MKKIFLLFALAFPYILFAQSQNPPSLKWKHIETKHFNIIFNPQIEQYARLTAAMMDSFYNADTKIFIDNFPKKVDLLLYTHSSITNAYAALAPRRMVWYLNPPASPSFSISPWNKMLGIHEFRHITQFSQMKDGFTQLAYFFFGQDAWMALSSWAFPNWFFEGDAVFNETKYSNNGRGRMPSFALPLRTIYLNKEKISYEKALFRSYKTYYPNHYYLGYHMVSYINRHYGEKIWRKIIYRTDLFSFCPYSFEKSVKKYTGFNVRKTYKKTFNELDSIWTLQLKNIDTTQAKFVKTKKKHGWTNYYDPQIISKDSILAIKSGLDDNPKLVILSNGKEKDLREISGNNISYSNNLVCWTTFHENIRYGEQSYSDLVVYNLKTKKLKQITDKDRIYSPEFSHSGNKIACIRFGDNLIPQLIILDKNGNEIFNYKGKIEENFLMPVWTPSDSAIVFLKTSPKGESMLMINLNSKKIKTLIKPSWIKFDKPFCYKDYVIFNYDYTGITNIYALNLKSNKIKQITSRPFAAIQAVVNKYNNKIYFTDYELDGLNIAKMPIDTSNWIPLNKLKTFRPDYFVGPKTKNTIKNIDISFAKNKAKNYKILDYKPYKHIINIHSWNPTAYNKMIGLQIYSDDIMNTTGITTSIVADPITKAIMAKANIEYKKYFPIFSLGISSGRMGQILDNDANSKNKIDSIANWNQNSISLGIKTPLNFSKYTWYRNLTLAFNTKFSTISNITPKFQSELNFSYSKLLSYSFTASYVNRKYLCYRDLFPKFGQAFHFGFYQTPKIFKLSGFQFYSSATLYLPSILKHDGFKIKIAYEAKNPKQNDKYIYQANISVPRGYSNFYYEEIKKLSLDYTVPLWYPDINIPYFLFIKRIRTDLFYDYAMVSNTGDTKQLSSAGIDLIFDFNILRLNEITLNAGLRISYLMPQQKFHFQALFLNIPLNF